MRITLPSGTPAELTTPAGTPTLGVALAPDIGGLRPVFHDLCARLTSDYQWAVCAPEPFPGREAMTLEERFAAMAELTDARQLGDLAEAADATGAEQVAVLGFCMGGMYALKAAGTGRYTKAVAFYGMIHVPEGWRGSGHGDPLEAVASRPGTEVLAIIGGLDPYTPSDAVDELDALPHVTVVRYPDADHGFVHDPGRPSHRAGDAADAWDRVARFLGSS